MTNDNVKWWATGGGLCGALVGFSMPNEWPWFYQIAAIAVILIAAGYAIAKFTGGQSGDK